MRGTCKRLTATFVGFVNPRILSKHDYRPDKRDKASYAVLAQAVLLLTKLAT
jgi:hypothetical protein